MTSTENQAIKPGKHKLGYTRVTVGSLGYITGGSLWYARRAPGDGGTDWEYTQDARLAGLFGPRLQRRWISERGSTASIY